MTSAAVCTEGFGDKGKLQLCAQRLAAVCMALRTRRDLQLSAQIKTVVFVKS